MTASYPGSFPSFTVKTDLVDTIHAGDVDSLQDEVLSIENILGLQPHISTTPNPAGTFNTTSQTYANVVQRLANIETGIVADTHTQYLKNTGGGVATTSNNGVVPLTVQAKSGQTVDVFDVVAPNGTTTYFKVDNGGTVWAGTQALPLGLINTVKITSNSAGLGGFEAMLTSLTQNFTAVSGRAYRISLNILVGDLNNTFTTLALKLRDGTTTSDPILANAPGMSPGINSSGVGGTGLHFTWYLDTLAAGVHHITASIQATGAGANMQLLAGPSNPCVMWVEDIGT